MKYYDDFLDYVLPSVPSCDANTAKFAIRNAAIELTEESGWEFRKLATIDIVSGTAEYDLTFDTGETLAFVTNVTYDGVEVPPATEELLDSRVFKWREETGTSPRAYIQRTKGKIMLFPIPDENKTAGLVIEASIKPTRNGDKVPDEFFEEFAEVVAAGALARLFRMPRRPWSDADASRLQAAIFNSGKTNAKIQYYKSKTTAPLQVKLTRRI